MAEVILKYLPLSQMTEAAAARTFCGMVLDGFDVQNAIDRTTDLAALLHAKDVALRGSEKFWAERVAHRIFACDPTPEHRCEWASCLLSLGRIAEARDILSACEPSDNESYRRAQAILCAKEGRTAEALALFDTLPGGRERFYPPSVVLTTAEEMMSDTSVADTKRLIDALRERYPHHWLIRSLSVRCHLYAGDLRQARVLAEVPDEDLRRAPLYERRRFSEAVAEIYHVMGWTHQLFDFIRERLGKDPAHWVLYGLAANAARLTGRDKEYSALVAAIPDELAETAEGMSVLFRWHLETGSRPQAAELCAKLRPLSAEWFLNAELFLQWQSAGTVDDAYEACRIAGIPLLGPTLCYSLHAYYYDCTPYNLQRSLAKLEAFVHLAHTNAYFWQCYLRCLVGLERYDAAEAHFRNLPVGLANSIMLKPFEMFFQARRGEDRTSKSGWMKFLTATKFSCINAHSSYPQTVRLKYVEKPGAILLFMTVFNGVEYLDWFLSHYRDMGVDHFFITDNGSSDGTLERLLAEPDVSVFSNTDSFAKSAFAVLWTNHLMQRFGLGHWCFHVDSDEGFVFPGYGEGRSLRDLTGYCERRGFELVGASAIDLYPADPNVASDENAFSASCYFDVDYIKLPSEMPPYFIVQGGLRRRMTKLAMSLHKSPLLRLGRDTRFIECNHSATHLRLADIWAALLHYKFAGDIKRRLSETISRGEHFGEAVSYRRLQNSLAPESGGSLLSEFSRRYSGPGSLLANGLMSTSDKWWRDPAGRAQDAPAG